MISIPAIIASIVVKKYDGSIKIRDRRSEFDVTETLVTAT